MKTHEKPLLEQFHNLKQENELLKKKIFDLSRSQKINQVLFRITNALNTAFDLNQLCDMIHLALSRIIHVPGFYIALVDSAQKTVSFPYHSPARENTVEPPQNMEQIELLIKDIVKSGRSLMLTRDDFSQTFQNQDKPLSFQPPEIWIGIPLKVRNEVIGVMAAQSYTDPNQYGETDINLLHSVSHYVATAVERKKAEDTLRESEERFRTLQEASFGGIGIHEKGLILDANQGLSKLTGYSHDELIGMNGLLLIDESTRDMVMEKIISGYEKPYDAVGIRKDGSTYPLEIQGKEIPYHGRTVRVTEFRDITERKRTETAMRENEERLIQLQKMEAIGTLAGGVAHDFNNLLGGILGNAGLLKKLLPPDSPSYQKAVTIEKIVHRGANLAGQLLGFARGGKYKVVPINMNRLIQDTLNMFGRTCKNNQIHTRFQQDIWAIEGDRTQLEQVILNLLINSTDAMPEGGEIHIHTQNTIVSEIPAEPHLENQGKYISITIRDTGFGMDKDTRSKIFDPFFTTKEQGKGTGLGLSSAYGIIKNHYGYIDVYSEPNRGAIFTILLPASDKTIDKDDQTDYQLKTGNETMLPMDDEFTCRDTDEEEIK